MNSSFVPAVVVAEPVRPGVSPRANSAAHASGQRTGGSDFSGRQAKRTCHRVVLGLSLAMLAAGGLLQLTDSGDVALPLCGLRLPALCTWRRSFGIDCPGCGLTRSVIAAEHGQWSAAWGFNPVGILLVALALYQIPYRAIQLRRLTTGRRELWHPHAACPLTIGAILLFAQWLWRMFA